MSVVKMDHYSLKYLLDQHLATIPQHQWVSKLMGLDFVVEYKLGTSNRVTDALSRQSKEEAEELVALSAPTFMVFDTLRTELDEVAALRRLRDEIVAGERGDKWQVVDGLIRYKPTVCSDLIRTRLGMSIRVRSPVPIGYPTR
jgi:hypothetical protein